MDARDLSEKLFKMWQEKYPKDSGTIHKSLKKVPVVVWTSEGYKYVEGIIVNQMGSIEILLDEDE